MKPAIRQFDQKLGHWVDRLPKWVRPFMELMTLLGQPPVTVGFAAAVVGYGVALEKPHFITSGSIAIITLGVASLLKIFLRRKRPVNEYVKSMLFQTFSFPSGHAAGAIVSSGLGAILVAEKWPEFAIVAWIIAFLLSFWIGISRIYLGAHYASDVVGGWIVGGTGVVVIAIIEQTI
ncbi:MAG: superfamily protein [Candidatus Saccharibacteria bacterium]|nr:superfamily protein [Candidatus Saccharibacteria bacterium]